MGEGSSRGETIAGIAGLVLIFDMFIVGWFGLHGFTGDCFETLKDWVGILLVFTAFAGMALALFGSDLVRVDVPLSLVTTGLGVLSALVILIHIFSPPSVGNVDLDPQLGAWLGLISALAVAVGGYLTMKDEGVIAFE